MAIILEIGSNTFLVCRDIELFIEVVKAIIFVYVPYMHHALYIYGKTHEIN